jgi:hypothetical protein
MDPFDLAEQHPAFVVSRTHAIADSERLVNHVRRLRRASLVREIVLRPWSPSAAAAPSVSRLPPGCA